MDNKTALDRFVHGGRIIAAFAMGGAVLASLSVGWLPALAAVDVHAVGAAVGGLAGAFANARHIV